MDGSGAEELAELARFREGLYGCFGRWRDTLFEVTDALAGVTRPVRSVAELMFESVSRRGWGSVYQALEHGQIDTVAVRRLLVGAVPVPAVGRVPVFAVDASKFPRPYTRYVSDVGMQYNAEAEGYGGCRAIPGWSMQQVAWTANLDPGSPRSPTGSWCLPTEVRRVGTEDNGNEVAAEQIAQVASAWHERCPDTVPLMLLDSGYCPIYLTQQLPADTQILVRLREDRVFFAPPPPPPSVAGKVGRPAKHGARFALNEPDTWGEPDAQYRHRAPDGTIVWARAWHQRHPRPKQRRKWAGTDIVSGTLIRCETTSASGHTQHWWLWWAGPSEAFDLALLAHAYLHRFTIEHGFRYAKQDLFWTGHTPIDPEQAERWSWLIAATYAQLFLARPLAVDQRLPWEKPTTADRLSPRRVRRTFRHITADLPTPARSPKSSRPGPGRPKGAKNKHTRPRQPVHIKGRLANTGHRKGKKPANKTTQRP